MNWNHPGSEIDRYARALGEHREDVRNLLTLLKNYPGSADRIRHELKFKYKREFQDVLSEFPFPPLAPEDVIEDGISISDVVVKGNKREIFKEPAAAFTEGNKIICGSIGSGKSRAVKKAFQACVKLNVPPMLTDSHLEHTDLLNLYKPGEVLLIDPRLLLHQLLMPPPGCPQDGWDGLINLLIREALFMRDASVHIWNQIIAVLRSGGNIYPSITEIYEYAKKQKIPGQNLRRIQSFETVLNRTSSLQNTGFDGHKMHRLEILTEKPTIIETGHLFDPIYLRFFMNVLLAQLMFYREFNPSPLSRNALLIEESHDFYLLNKIGKRSDLSDPFIYTIPREMRKRGFSISFICHSPFLMPAQVMCTISDFSIFNLPNVKDIPVVALPAGLSKDEIEELPKLKQRQCVRKANWASQAYLTEIHNFESQVPDPKRVEEFRKETMKLLSPVRVSFVPNPVDSEYKSDSSSNVSGGESGYQALSNQWKSYIRDCKKFPLDNRKMRQKRLGLSNWELTKMVSALSRYKLIIPHRISWGKRGSAELIDEVTEEGSRFIGESYAPLKGKGSFFHRIVQLKLSKSLKNVVIEYNGADLAWIKPNAVTIALEVELNPGTPHILTNIRRDLTIPG
ncbi:MAG: hypothetical protein JW755_05570, partial [Candidatus Aminicenantes bacterium]|nr:hypothetical protein [Candidatus Aminicenantes bacterium]